MIFEKDYLPMFRDAVTNLKYVDLLLNAFDSQFYRMHMATDMEYTMLTSALKTKRSGYTLIQEKTEYGFSE